MQTISLVPILREAAVEEFAIERRVRFLPGRFEMAASADRIADPMVELTEHGVEKK